MSAANVDHTSVVGVSGCTQVTLKEKVQAFPDLKTLTFEGIPSSQIKWGMVSRISVPGGGQLERSNFYPVWRNMKLRFDCGLGQVVNFVTGIKMCPLGYLNAIESIALTVDNQELMTVSGGTHGNLAQKYIDAIFRRAPQYPGETYFLNALFDLTRGADDTHGSNYFCRYDTSTDDSQAMMQDRGISLALLFDGLGEEIDPRMFGRELQIEVTLRDMPHTIDGKHGALMVYSAVGGDGTEDTRNYFHFANMRVEIEQQSFPKDPFPKRSFFTHTFLDWQLSPQNIDLYTAGITHRFQLPRQILMSVCFKLSYLIICF